MRATVGIIGGSGLYSLLDNATSVTVETPYGPPSDEITIASVGSTNVAFLPRHGRAHSIPPHRINYRANLWALQSLGVTRVIAPCAVGSLRRELAPGHAVICDQFIDRTNSRADTYFDGPEVAHLSDADPYCPQLRPLVIASGHAAGMTVHEQGTMVVIQGPRFSTRAESKWFSSMGADVVGMTQYPEVVLARELGMCYATMAIVTDYDCGLEGESGIAPVTHEEVLRVFSQNIAALRTAVHHVLGSLPTEWACVCQQSRPQPMK